ncbi:hypothetical protein [Acinetobacter bereziniae]|uniref:hypothetical protein n=1 Tax=Acinetobacter bereziniae TaxID=106648 RepID=UPI002090ABA8|nr:hypothetical protein [Acinetobacter bereziniae]
MNDLNKKSLLFLFILVSFKAFAENKTNELEDILQNDEGGHCFVLANRAFSIMGLRQDGRKISDLQNELLSVDEKYNKNEINELIQKAYKEPINSNVMGKMVIMSNFMNDIEQECMQQNPNNNGYF